MQASKEQAKSNDHKLASSYVELFTRGFQSGKLPALEPDMLSIIRNATNRAEFNAEITRLTVDFTPNAKMALQSLKSEQLTKVDANSLLSLFELQRQEQDRQEGIVTQSFMP